MLYAVIALCLLSALLALTYLLAGISLYAVLDDLAPGQVSLSRCLFRWWSCLLGASDDATPEDDIGT